MREIICLHVGQAGIQLAQASWELFCLEYKIKPGGIINQFEDSDDMGTSYESLFTLSRDGQYVPRAVCIDLEPTVVDEIRTGLYRNLFHPEFLISGKEDASNNFARGYYQLGRLQMDKTMKAMRKLVDNCNNLQGILLTHSYGGGTGSGVTSLILERLSEEYSKSTKMEIIISASPDYSTATVEPYNQVLSVHHSTEHVDLAFLMDNQTIYKICTEHLSKLSITYCDINRLVARLISSITSSIRFTGQLNADMDQIQTNLVPYPRIHYPLIRHAPLVCQNEIDHMPVSIKALTNLLFDGSSETLTIDTSVGKYMACAMTYQGNVTPLDVNNSINLIKKRNDVKFVSWCPTGFKIGINYQMPVAVQGSHLAVSDKAVTLMANTTAMDQVWGRIGKKFRHLFAKQAFVHWFVGEGMEEAELSGAEIEIQELIQAYKELYENSDELDSKKNSGKTSKSTNSSKKSETPKSLASSKKSETPKSLASSKKSETLKSLASSKKSETLKSHDSIKRESLSRDQIIEKWNISEKDHSPDLPPNKSSPRDSTYKSVNSTGMNATPINLDSQQQTPKSADSQRKNANQNADNLHEKSLEIDLYDDSQ